MKFFGKFDKICQRNSRHEFYSLRLFYFAISLVSAILLDVFYFSYCENCNNSSFFASCVFSQNLTGNTTPIARGDGDALFREMLSAIEGTISISARIRQQVILFGQEYNASGSYQELKVPELHGKETARFRLELQIQPPANDDGIGTTNSLTIVCDRNYRYVYKSTSIEGIKKLERMEIAPVLKAIEASGRSDIPQELGSMWGLGGLAGMLREMRNRYDFMDAPIQTQISEKNGSIGVWKIRGRLKSSLLETLTTALDGKKTSVPSQIPTCIDIYIGIEDRFPFRFDYFWTPDGSDPESERFGYLLYYNQILHEGNIPENTFDYLPNENIHSDDSTDEMVKKILNAKY